MNISAEAAQVDLSGYTDWNMAVSLSAVSMNGTRLELSAA